MNKWLACALVALTSGCPDVKTDADETSAEPTVEFDPSNSIVPFPNNLLISQETGKVNVPAGCNEGAASKATREGVLNKLDGFGTFETAMSVTLTEPVDMASVTADNIVLFKAGADPSAATAIPVVVIPGSSIRYAKQTRNADMSLTCEEPNPIDSITIVPRVPLEQKSTYFVALKTGLKSADGGDYVPSFTWSLVRQETNPVTLDDSGNVIADRTPLDPSTPAGLASLKGIDLLWKAHNPVLAFLGAKGIDRNDVLLAWSFKTQTVQDALDKSVAGTPLTMLNDVAVTGPSDAVPVPLSLTVLAGLPGSRAQLPFSACGGDATATPPVPAEANDVQCLLKMVLGGQAFPPTCNTVATCNAVFAAGVGRCALFGCANVGDVMTGRVKSPQFQVQRDNTVVPAQKIPGPWGDPVKPAKAEDEQLGALMMIPTGTAPGGGWPTAVFQHGLGQSNSNLFFIGGNLAKAPPTGGTGFATIAIDAVAHGSRRRQISNTGACAAPPLGAACFAGFLSPDLGTTRDNIRQTVVDHNQVLAALKKCTGGAANCGTFVVDPAHVVYIGQSLGGIIGGVTTVTNTDIKASVLNVPGVGWADVFENTETLDIRCTLVDGLIDGGIVIGEKRDTKNTATEADDTGLCTTQDWKTQPGYRQFSAIGRWVLDPADPANFVTRLVAGGGMGGSRKFLLQMVVGDKVVPNVATQNEAALTGRMASPADPGTSAAPTPSMAITATMPASKFVTYTNLPPTATPAFPGNTFAHGSLLSPAPSVVDPAMQCNLGTGQFCDGVLGTARMFVDAYTYLVINR